MTRSFTVVIERDSESGWLVGEVVELPGCYTQAPDLPSLEANVREAIAAYLQTAESDEPTSDFLGRLRLVPYKELRKLAEKLGFRWTRCVGSHNTFRGEDGRIVVIPDHGSQVIVRPLLRKIVRDLGLTIDQHNRVMDDL